MFTIEIKTGGSAFRDPDSGEFSAVMLRAELARILDGVNAKIGAGQSSGVCIDLNGNRCGSWKLDEDDVLPNTRIDYLYRDASNYKCQQTFVVEGRISQDQIESILGCLDGQEFFIPEQLDMPLIRNWTVSEDDHPWCELDSRSFSFTDAAPDVPGFTVDELVKKFQDAKGAWDDVTYSPVVEE